MNRFSEQARSLLAVASLALGAAAALAGPGAAYDVRLAIQSRNAGQIQTRNVPLINDIAGGPMGLLAGEGPHLIASDPTFYPRHLAKFTADLTETIPDPNFSGIVIMDYEQWWPCWEWTEPAVQQRWDSYIRTSRPDLLAGHTAVEQTAIIQAEYKKETRKYYETTAGYVRTLRPKAKISFYGLPLRTYWIFNGVPQGGIDINVYRQIHEQDLGWYFDLVDVVCPSIYPLYKHSTPPTGNIHDPSENQAYILGMVSEAVRNSRGKPVYPFFTLKYHPSSGYVDQFINATNLRQGIELPRQAGATGVVIWDFFYNDTQLNDWQSYYDRFARDFINNVIYPGTPVKPAGGSSGAITLNLGNVPPTPSADPSADVAEIAPGTLKVDH